ncbi:MAG: hypothetical protein RH862_18795 [Leptospiraceae bacterium]
MDEAHSDKKEKKLKRLHMLLPETEWSHLKQLAERRGVSVSELIRSAYQDLYWPRSRIRAMQRLAQWNDEPPLAETESTSLKEVLERNFK